MTLAANVASGTDVGSLEGTDITKRSIRVADDLYEWLRETAFCAHVSMNALVVAALRRSHADEAI